MVHELGLEAGDKLVARLGAGVITLRPRQKLDRLAAFFAHQSVVVVEASPEIARTAAHVRAETDLRLPDAFIVATAVVSECDALVGNDRDCARRVKAIPYVYLEDVIAGGRSL